MTRWEHPALPAHRADSRPTIRSCLESDGAAIVRCDQFGFGVNRARLIRALVKDSELALVATSHDAGEIEGFGLLRAGACAHYLGPVVAKNERAGKELVEALLAGVSGRRMFWDIPDQNGAALRVARDRGFKPKRQLTRMVLGKNVTAGAPSNQFAIAGPEVG